jgi:hypothetical protein
MGTENLYIRDAFVLFNLSKIRFSVHTVSLNFVKQCTVYEH